MTSEDSSLLLMILIVGGIILGIFIAVLITETATQIHKRFDKLEKWLFDSLYSIDQDVVLPESTVIKSSNSPASVYNPNEDPYSEFNGKQDDWTD